MEITIGVGVILLLLILFKHRLMPSTKVTRSKKRKNKIIQDIDEIGSGSQRLSAHPYHCVTVTPSKQHCQASEAILNKRFLSQEAPGIPLAQCDSPHCQCHYTHYDDRRTPNSDRRTDFGINHELYGAFGEKSRRLKPRGRRRTEH